MTQFCPEKSDPTQCNCPVGSCVKREMRELREPGGAARALEAYRDQLRARAAELEGGMDPRDLPYRLQTIGVPAEDISALRRTLDQGAALEAAKKFLGAPRAVAMRFLLLLGGVGVGKSLAAAYVVRDAARRHNWNSQASGGAPVEPIQFVRAGSLTRLDAYDKPDTLRLESLRRCELLVVDDMGDEGGPIARGALTETLLARDHGGRKTVLTTNLAVERFRELYGSALMDRIRVRGIFPDLSKEKSRRRKAA